ncbi:MAG: glycosyltransferase family 39 protein [Verrucomicrobiota bacterium]
MFQIELGRGKVVLRWVVVALAAVALAIWYTASEFRGLEKREAQDLAQLARNISRGEGFTTSVIRPISLWHLKTYRDDHQPHFDQHPDLYNPPLYPLVLSGIFRLAGGKVFQAKLQDQIYTPEQWLILPFNQVCLLASLLLVYFWAKQLFDQRIAVTAGLLLLFSDTLWSYGVSGLPTTFLMFLVLAAAYCLYRADARLNGGETPQPADFGSIALIVGSAVLMGLSYLTRYSSFFLMIPLAIYAARAMRGRRAVLWAGIYVAIFLVVIAPWLMRNYQISHSFLGIARYQIIGSESLFRNYDIDLAGSWTLRSTLSRCLTQLRSAWMDSFRNVGSDVSVFFFSVGLLYGFRRDDTARLRRFLVLALLAGMVSITLVGIPGDPGSTTSVNGGNLLVLFLPLIMVFGVAFFYLLLDRIQFQMRLTQLATIGAFAAVNVAPLVLTLLPPSRGPYPYPPYCAPYTRLISHWFDNNEVGVSDAPWSVAWYADRRCVWLPQTPEQFVEIHDFVAPNNTQFMFLTPFMLDRRSQSEIVKGEFKPWASIVRGQVPERFPFRAITLVPPDTDQILFATQARWQTRPIGLTLETEKGKKSANPTNDVPAKPIGGAGS